MSGLVLSIRQSLLAYIFHGRRLPPPPPALYGALFLAAPGDDEQGGVEVSAPDYRRLALKWTEPDGMSRVANPDELQWPVARSTWGAITSVGIYDAPTGGTLWAIAEPGETLTIIRNDQYVLPKEALEFMLLAATVPQTPAEPA